MLGAILLPELDRQASTAFSSGLRRRINPQGFVEGVPRLDKPFFRLELRCALFKLRKIHCAAAFTDHGH